MIQATVAGATVLVVALCVLNVWRFWQSEWDHLDREDWS